MLLIRGRKELVITMKSSINKALKYYKGTAEEMQLRFLLHMIREAANDGHLDVCIQVYKISKINMATLRHEILEPSGFDSKEFESNEMKMLLISWN